MKTPRNRNDAAAAQSIPRRRFLRDAGLAAGGAGCFPAILRAADAGGDDPVRLAIIGLGNKGRHLIDIFSRTPGARITALCEVDPKRLAPEVEKLKGKGVTFFPTTDLRQVLERDDVDAVVITTPNHWHSLLAVWAIEAGKDVYVEKPVSHNMWEGGRLVEAAEKSGRIVQAGLQYRSCNGLRAAGTWLREGHLGKALWVHVPWYERRPAIGKCDPFTPDWLDYDLWCGPAPVGPLTRPRLHYDWHWVWSTGDGDSVGSSVHPLDIVRMFLPGMVYPKRVVSMGGRFTYDDAAETPNTQFTLLEYPDFPVVIENRNLPVKPGSNAMASYRGIREGLVIQYEGGFFAGFRGGGKVFDKDDRELKRFDGDGGVLTHAANFIEAVRTRKAERLNTPIAEGHVSSSVCHLGNISYRLGESRSTAVCRQALGEHGPALEGFEALAESVGKLGVDFTETPFTVGAALEVDENTGKILAVVGGESRLDEARKLAQGSYRPCYSLRT